MNVLGLLCAVGVSAVSAAFSVQPKKTSLTITDTSYTFNVSYNIDNPDFNTFLNDTTKLSYSVIEFYSLNQGFWGYDDVYSSVVEHKTYLNNYKDVATYDNFVVGYCDTYIRSGGGLTISFYRSFLGGVVSPFGYNVVQDSIILEDMYSSCLYTFYDVEDDYFVSTWADLQFDFTDYVLNLSAIDHYLVSNSNYDNSFGVLGNFTLLYGFNPTTLTNFVNSAQRIIFEIASDSDEGYATGYNDGWQSGYDAGRGDGYNEGASQGYSDGFDSGFDNGYRVGYADGVDQSQYGFMNLFGAIADTPVLMIRSMFDFDLFGMNLLTVVLSLFTALILFFIARKLL